MGNECRIKGVRGFEPVDDLSVLRCYAVTLLFISWDKSHFVGPFVVGIYSAYCKIGENWNNASILASQYLPDPEISEWLD